MCQQMHFMAVKKLRKIKCSVLKTVHLQQLKAKDLSIEGK